MDKQFNIQGIRSRCRRKTYLSVPMVQHQLRSFWGWWEPTQQTGQVKRLCSTLSVHQQVPHLKLTWV
jgi:hypothetical protein